MNRKILASDKKILLFGDERLYTEIKNEINETHIYLYGQLNSEDLNKKDVFSKFENALQRNQNITIYINCYGGSAIDGIVIYDLLKNFDKEVNVIIEGIVSDFSIPIALSGTNIKMTENAFFNIETIKTVVTGSKDVFFSEIAKLETAEKSLLNIFNSRVLETYQTTIKQYLNDSNGVWIDAQSCKKFNLCDEVITPIKKRLHQKDEKVSAMYITAKDSKETTIKASQYLKGRFNWTFANWQDNDPKGLEQLSFRFPETFENLFNAQYKNQETIIKNKNNMNTEKKENWTFTDWQNNDPKGLEAMHSENPKKFNDLFNSEYPIDKKNIDYPKELPQNRKNWTFTDWQNNDPKGLTTLFENHKDYATSLTLN